MFNGSTVSIIVPVYKVEIELDRCVHSLVNQTHPNIEIILVDDGSPDTCPELCDQYAKEDNRIKVVHKENGGLSDARNAGLKKATGDYILYVDSDDYIDLDSCERLLNAIGDQEVDIVVGNAIMEKPDGQKSAGDDPKRRKQSSYCQPVRSVKIRTGRTGQESPNADAYSPGRYPHRRNGGSASAGYRAGSVPGESGVHTS